MKIARYMLLLLGALTVVACYYLPVYRSYSDVNLGIEFEYDSAKWRLEKRDENLLVFENLSPHAGDSSDIGFWVFKDARPLAEYVKEQISTNDTEVITLWGNSGLRVLVENRVNSGSGYILSDSETVPLEVIFTTEYLSISDGSSIAVIAGDAMWISEFVGEVRDFAFTAQPLNVDVNSGE